MADMTTEQRLEAFKARVLKALGPKGVSVDPVEIAPLVSDWRERWKGETPVLIKPSSTEETSIAMTLAAEYGLAVTPQGGNSGLVNGGIPYGEILISMRRMNAIREIDVLNDAMTVEAGVILTTAQEKADEADRLFPLSLAAEGVATIGGLISTNAGGVAVLRYGMMRDLVLGIEAVLPDGRVWNGLRALRKDNTGYDLKQLFIGAEGTLGVVTAATLKLFPKPAVKEVAWCTLATAADAVAFLAKAKALSGGAVTGFELVSTSCVDLVTRHIPDVRDPLPSDAPWRVLMELSLPQREGAREMIEAILGDALEAELIQDAVIAESEAQPQLPWKIREMVPIAEKAHGKAVKHDVSVPVSRIAELLDKGAEAIARIEPGTEIIAFGHVGDGNIHYNMTPPPGIDGDEFVTGRGLVVSGVVNDLVSSLNGSISAEHGIGMLKRDELARRKSDVEIDLMRAVKAAFDPENRMNPGRVIQPE